MTVSTIPPEFLAPKHLFQGHFKPAFTRWWSSDRTPLPPLGTKSRKIFSTAASGNRNSYSPCAYLDTWPLHHRRIKGLGFKACSMDFNAF